MNWFTQALITSLICNLLMAYVYTFLYTLEKKQFLLIWSIGWGFQGIRFAFMLLVQFDIGTDLSLIGSHSSTLISGAMLLWGFKSFTGQSFSRRWILAAGAGIIWIIIADITGTSAIVFSTITFLVISTSYLWIGINIIRVEDIKGSHKLHVGYGFILWGFFVTNSLSLT